MHIPVLVKEVLHYLEPKENENFVDATIGEGGHALEILKKNGPSGKLLGIDWDKNQVENSKLHLSGFQGRTTLVNDSYGNIKDIVEKLNFKPVHGILLDLGFSSWHIQMSGRGFSFQKDEPLDMRYNIEDQKSNIKNQNYLTAEEIVNEYPEEEIEKILREFGEERFSKQIAKKIVEYRKLKEVKTTFDLKGIIKKSIPEKFRHGNIHFATRTFQALRIAVNREMDNLRSFLPQAIEVLSKSGRLVVISFHSLEDRIIKNFFKDREKLNQIKILTKKPIKASFQEILENPRSRSAKLRAIVKV